MTEVLFELLAVRADIVLTASAWILNAFATLMWLDSDTHVERRKGVLYAVAIGITGLTLLSLGHYLSFVSYFYGAAVWFALAVQQQ